MANLTSNINQNLGGILESLDQEPLSDREAKDALQDTIDRFIEPSFDYKDEIDFEDDIDITADLKIARRMIMETIDKSKKISDAVICTLVVDTSNPTFLQLAQEANRTIQQSVKSLTDIHAAYTKIKAQKMRNDLTKDLPKPESEDAPIKSGMTFE